MFDTSLSGLGRSISTQTIYTSLRSDGNTSKSTASLESSMVRFGGQDSLLSLPVLEVQNSGTHQWRRDLNR